MTHRRHVTVFNLLAVLVVSLACINQAKATERLIWDKHPLQLSLPVNQERLVSFPQSVRVGLPESIAAQLRTQSLDGTVYWTATAPFDKTRVQVQSTDGRQLYLIDLSASTGSDTSDVQILLPSRGSVSTHPTASQMTRTPNRAHRHIPNNSSLDYILLTRFAAQQLYAPKRLLNTPPQVQRSRVKQRAISHLLRGAQIQAIPIAAWRKGRLFVTAVRLQNQTDQSMTLDPRNLRGRWRTATFQHGILKAKGSSEDTTAVYLVSDHPFEQAL
jgi:integrating conjugative element protein (TIGR03749 family)